MECGPLKVAHCIEPIVVCLTDIGVPRGKTVSHENSVYPKVAANLFKCPES